MTNIQLPPDPEGMNDSRAAWAGHAIHQFALTTGSDEQDALSDLLADLIRYHDLAGEGDATRKRKAASKTEHTCPACDQNAWAKPGAHLICGDCSADMEAEEPE